MAGLRAANAIAPHHGVLVVTKDALRESNSNYAQGGIAGVLDPEDRFESHIADTLSAGGNLCDIDIVDMVVREGPRRIEELIRWGTDFDTENGELELGREGGHSRERIVHARGDATGREIMRVVIELTRQKANIDIWEDAFTVDLLTHEGRCRGAVIVAKDGQQLMVWAKETILCTGALAKSSANRRTHRLRPVMVMRWPTELACNCETWNSCSSIPTVLYIAGSSRSLITEAVRGEGAHLVDVNGHRFMPEYDQRAELAPRDVVSQSIIRQMAATKHPSVYLDLSHLNANHVRERFPGIDEACSKFGLDITSDRIPVRPGCALHDRRRHRRSTRQNNIAGTMGCGRSEQQRIARCEPVGQ